MVFLLNDLSLQKMYTLHYYISNIVIYPSNVLFLSQCYNITCLSNNHATHIASLQFLDLLFTNIYQSFFCILATRWIICLYAIYVQVEHYLYLQDMFGIWIDADRNLKSNRFSYSQNHLLNSSQKSSQAKERKTIRWHYSYSLICHTCLINCFSMCLSVN